MPSCPICGAQVNEGAGFCPKCLRRLMKGQAPKGKSRKKLAGIIVACVIVVGAVIAVTTLLPKVPSGSVAELEYVAVSAYDLAKELFAPELAGLQRDDLWKDYEGKRVEWTNELKYVLSEKEGLVAHFVNPLDWARTEVVAFFDEDQRSSLLELNEGDLVTYTGVLDSFEGAKIGLADCIVVSLPIVPLWWNSDIDTHSKRIILGDEVLCLGPSAYDDATDYRPRPAPKIAAIDRETGKLLWESETTESILVGIDSRYVYAWHHLTWPVQRRGPDPCYWCVFNITASNITSGQIDRMPLTLREDIKCREIDDCLPDEWSKSDFMDCCVSKGRVKGEIEIASNGEQGLVFLIDKPILSELTYAYQGVIYKTACAVYTGASRECGALQALSKQTSEVLWIMTFQERGVIDFSVVGGILYVLTDKGIGAFQL